MNAIDPEPAVSVTLQTRGGPYMKRQTQLHNLSLTQQTLGRRLGRVQRAKLEQLLMQSSATCGRPERIGHLSSRPAGASRQVAALRLRRIRCQSALTHFLSLERMVDLSLHAAEKLKSS